MLSLAVPVPDSHEEVDMDMAVVTASLLVDMVMGVATASLLAFLSITVTRGLGVSLYAPLSQQITVCSGRLLALLYS